MKSFANILVIADTDQAASTALNRALTLAITSHASFTLAGIVELTPRGMRMSATAAVLEELVDAEVSEKLERLEKTVKGPAKQGVDIKAKVLVGKPYLEIIREVLRNKHDLVIKCVEPTESFTNVLFGSTDMHLMRNCPCPVLIFKPPDHDHYRCILAAVDQDAEDTQRDALNRPILEMATSLALAESSELHIVHAWEMYAENFLRSPRLNNTEAEVDAMVAEEELARRQWLQQLLDEYGATEGKDAINYLLPQQHLVKGQARHVVPAKARELDADLMIMGTVARTGIPGFVMGNTAESILNQIDCSVLTIKPPGFVSPVSL